MARIMSILFVPQDVAVPDVFPTEVGHIVDHCRRLVGWVDVGELHCTADAADRVSHIQTAGRCWAGPMGAFVSSV